MKLPEPKEKYTDIAIWIDANAYEPSADENRLFEGLYHLTYMLAIKGEYFVKYQWYDEFALQVATAMFFRYRRKPNAPKIKSVLNYLKQVAPLRKNSFLSTKEEFVTESHTESEIPISNFVLEDYVQEYTYITDELGVKFNLWGVEKTVYNFLQKIPHKKNSAEWENIYISCLLTLLRGLTPSKKLIKELHIDPSTNNPVLFERLYTCSRQQKPVLYHLDESMENYIRVLVNEIRHCMASNINNVYETHLSEKAITEDMIAALYSGDYDEH